MAYREKHIDKFSAISLGAMSGDLTGRIELSMVGQERQFRQLAALNQHESLTPGQRKRVQTCLKSIENHQIRINDYRTSLEILHQIMRLKIAEGC